MFGCYKTKTKCLKERKMKKLNRTFLIIIFPKPSYIHCLLLTVMLGNIINVTMLSLNISLNTAASALLSICWVNHQTQHGQEIWLVRVRVCPFYSYLSLQKEVNYLSLFANLCLFSFGKVCFLFILCLFREIHHVNMNLLKTSLQVMTIGSS